MGKKSSLPPLYWAKIPLKDRKTCKAGLVDVPFLLVHEVLPTLVDKGQGYLYTIAEECDELAKLRAEVQNARNAA